ncbi:MAG: glucose-1-phosphate adenylyltransferase [Clostridia bacterium]|nr:glucose-1-phosphate adenylyltransferase [Clostridia bacterium]
MKAKKECVAMLLAGGQGSRLYALTTTVAKPAVQFGGKYRIIDFTLSNCVNSGIDTVGVLTQYQPLVLNEYVGNGQPWDLDRTFGGVKILPPYQAADHADWYKGTANAIYQNMRFIDRYDPEYVLILSGDHIYTMDYNAMLAYHKQQDADCTIAVISVPKEDVSRFGILSADESGRITKFEEKPKQSDSTDASMGIYIFKKDKLFSYLNADAADPASDNDFGKNIIPTMLNAGEKMFAYPFVGYWKDVGTISSLWEANMDLLETSKTPFRINDRHKRVVSRSSIRAPHYMAENAIVDNSIITEGCQIYGTVKNSVLSPGVTVEDGAEVIDAVIHAGCTVKAGAKVYYSIIAGDVTIGENTVVGEKKETSPGITLVGAHQEIPANEVIPGNVIKTAKGAN